MADSLILFSTGLDKRSSYSTNDPGGMRYADNVVIDRPGVLEPRPGFANNSQSFSGSSAATKDERRIIQFYQAQPNSNVQYYFQTEQGVFDSNNVEVGLDAGPKLGTTSILQNGEYIGASHVLYHDVLYVPSADPDSIMGVARIDEYSTAAGSTGATRAGLPRGGQPILQEYVFTSSSINAWLPEGNNVAYRSVFVRRVDKNQRREYISAPSGRTVVSYREDFEFSPPSTYNTGSVILSVALPSEIVAGDFIQLYRSETTAEGVEPGDELDLAVEQIITATDVSQGFVNIHDTVPEDNRRTSLYTNATQQGAMNENGRPPACEVLELYEDMLFFGRVYEPERIVLEFAKEVASPWFMNLSESMVANPDPHLWLTSGSNLIHVVEAVNFNIFDGDDYNWTFLNPTDLNRYKGYFVVQASSSIAAYDDIRFDLGNIAINNYNFISSSANFTYTKGTPTTFTGSYIALGRPASANYAFDLGIGTWQQDFHIQPWIAVEDQWNVVPGTWSDPKIASWRTRWVGDNFFGSYAQMRGIDGLPQMAGALERAFDGELSVIANRNSIIFERPNSSLTFFQVRFPQGMAPYIYSTLNSGSFKEPFQPSGFTYPTVPLAVEYRSTARERKNRVYYSKKREPEHVPPVNFFDLGSDNEPIMAMKATKDALYVFKTDGIWIVQGSTPQDLRTFKIGNERLLHPRAVTMGQNTVFAWLDIGVCALGTGGVVQNLSEPRLDNWLRFIQTERQSITDPKYTDSYGTFLTYVEGSEQLLLGLPQSQVYGPETVETPFWTDRKHCPTILCYTINTQAWTTWSFRDYEISGADQLQGRLLLTGIENAYTSASLSTSVTLDGIQYEGTDYYLSGTFGEIFFAKFPTEEAPFSDHQGSVNIFAESPVVVNQDSAVYRVWSTALPAEIPVGTWLVGQGHPGDAPLTDLQRAIVLKVDPSYDTESIITGSQLEIKLYGTRGDYDASFSATTPTGFFTFWSATTAYRPVKQDMQWMPRVEGSAHFVKQWSVGSLAYEAQKRMYVSNMSFNTDIIPVSASINVMHRFVEPLSDIQFFSVIASYDKSQYGVENIFNVPRQVARSAVLYPRLTTVQGGGQWSLTSFSLTYEPSSTRVGPRFRTGYTKRRM